MKSKPSPVVHSATPALYGGLSLGFLKYAIATVLAASCAFLLIVTLCAPNQPLRIVGPVLQIIVSAISLVLLGRGKVHLALSTLIWATWAIASTVLFFFGGVRGTLVVIFPLIIMLGGWLLGTRQAVMLALVTTATTLTLMLTENAQKLPPQPVTGATMYGLIQILGIVFSTLLIVFLVRTYRKRLNEVKKLSVNLAQRTEESQRIAADLNTAQSVAHIGSWVYDFLTDRMVMSTEACRIFDIPQDIVSTRSAYLKRVHPDDLAKLEEDWENARQGQPLINVHRIMIHETPRWISQSGEVEFFPDGSPQRCIGTVQDITLLKQAEDEIRIAATAFESQEGMVITDADKKILRANPAFTRITGYTFDEVMGRTPALLKSGRHDEAFYQAMWENITAKGSWQGEIWNRRKSGEVYPEWLTITAVKDGAGQITHYIGALTDITLRKSAEDEIRNLAFYDPLTRLPNRRLLFDRLHQALASSARNGRQGALLFLDLDHFKTLNDTLGHDVGDLLLQHVAQRLCTCIREGDTVARFGGDEFVVMLVDLSTIHEQSVVQAQTVGEKILAALSQPYDLSGHEYRSTASVGITFFSNHQATPHELLKQADLAMYSAKATGRNTLCLFDPEMHLRENKRDNEHVESFQSPNHS